MKTKAQIKMMEAGYAQRDLEPILQKGSVYISTRITGKKPFSMDEIHVLSKLFDVKPEDIFIVFPISKEGRTA